MKLDSFRVKPGSTVDLSKWDPDDESAKVGDKAANLAKLTEFAEELDRLQDVFYAVHEHKLLVVLQGMDTSGKDGTIRHVFSCVDPLGVRVANFKAPSAEELDRDYLWRIHRQAPGKGEIVIFNRSHYEDVLITRVHQWITLEECQRRYQQINDFERLLTETGTLITKFFLHISKDEQRKRLQERLDNPKKAWKFNPGDLEERKRWDDYQSAYEDALSATSTKHAPWIIVPANSKIQRNLVISQILVDLLRGLKLEYPKMDKKLSGLVVR